MSIRRPGRPPLGSEARQHVSLRLDADVLAHFNAQGAGWQSQNNAVLRKAAGLRGNGRPTGEPQDPRNRTRPPEQEPDRLQSKKPLTKP